MAESSTERSRRSRKHTSGDHSLCKDAAQCIANAALATMETRGEKLLRELNAEALSPEMRVLAEEASRIADRLDRLDAILTGKRREWLYFRMGEDGEVTVILNGALSEARQQATALRGLMAEISRAKTAKPAAPTGGSLGGILGIADELAPRRKAPPA